MAAVTSSVAAAAAACQWNPSGQPKSYNSPNRTLRHNQII
jgi:hypothetical protein